MSGPPISNTFAGPSGSDTEYPAIAFRRPRMRSCPNVRPYSRSTVGAATLPGRSRPLHWEARPAPPTDMAHGRWRQLLRSRVQLHGRRGVPTGNRVVDCPIAVERPQGNRVADRPPTVGASRRAGPRGVTFVGAETSQVERRSRCLADLPMTSVRRSGSNWGWTARRLGGRSERSRRCRRVRTWIRGESPGRGRPRLVQVPPDALSHLRR